MSRTARSFCWNDPWTQRGRTSRFVWYLTRNRMAVKYRQTFFGYLWSLLTPLASVAIYYLVFRYFFRVGGTPEVPFFALFLSGFFFWDFGARALNESTFALLEMAHVMKNVRFPRHAVVLSSVFANALHALVALPLVVAALWLVGVPPGWGYLGLPVALVLTLMFLTGFALLLSVAAVFYNDLLHFIQILLDAAFFLSPVVYTTESLGWPERFKVLYVVLWPPASLIEFGRAAFLGCPLPAVTALSACAWAILLLAAGIWAFARYEDAAVLRL